MRLSAMRAFAAVLIVLGSAAVLGGCAAAPLPGLDLASFATEAEAMTALASAGDDPEAYGKNYCKDGVIPEVKTSHKFEISAKKNSALYQSIISTHVGTAGRPGRFSKSNL